MTEKSLLKKSVICRLFASAVVIAAGFSLREDEPDPWTIELSGRITKESIKKITDRLSESNKKDPAHPITITFNSKGGRVAPGYDLP